MSFQPQHVEGLVQPIVDLYLEAERILLERIAKSLAKGLDEPDWVERKLAEIQFAQAQTARQLESLGVEVTQQMAESILFAYNRGAATGLIDTKAAGLASADLPIGLPAVERLISETVAGATSTHAGILRSVRDVYQQVIAQSSSQVLLGTQTRREAAQSALDAFAKRGITGFVDRRGRKWEMSSYVEMATRSAVMRAGIQGHTDRLLANGQSLVYVSDHGQECPLCRPWEGKVLSLTGDTPHVGVTVAGTLERARSEGLFHPGCGHVLSLYIPGVTKLPTKTADPVGDANRQKLRYLERQVRASKRMKAVALDPDAAARAQLRVRRYQAAIRDHVATTSASRQPAREQIGKAH